MREIVLDTETTGRDPLNGDRIVEIGCLELVNLMQTGRTLHLYINPRRDIPAEVVAIHGITNEMVADKPGFDEIAGEFLDFIGNDPLVIHNASFDMGFLNMELSRLGFTPMPMTRAIDTLMMARQRFPGSPASLDALCRRFSIDNTNRTLHGALIDANLLSQVYLELKGGREPGLSLNVQRQAISMEQRQNRAVRPARLHQVHEKELADHVDMIGQLKNALWRLN
jgi:DNA polymerase-3 subunit epsilon